MTLEELEHPITYRQEIVAPLFRLIDASESAAVVGASSMGKSRLLAFILQQSTREHYMEDPNVPLLVKVDCNRMVEQSEWGLYELLLTAFTDACDQSPAISDLRPKLVQWYGEATATTNSLLAWRRLEAAARELCPKQRFCLILDAFDKSYKLLPAVVLRNLRSLRDANRYRISYLLMLRDDPSRLRLPDDSESFYQLISRSVFRLGPYLPNDAANVLRQLEVRKSHPLSAIQRQHVVDISGGHPGLMVTMLDILPAEADQPNWDWRAWASHQPTVDEECRKIWHSLEEEERTALQDMAYNVPPPENIRPLLTLKGLIRDEQDGRTAIFSPLFERFVENQGPAARAVISIDRGSGTVKRGADIISTLTTREFELMAFLYEHEGQICTRDEIVARVYPGEDGSGEQQRVDVLVGRLRKKIEPSSGKPRYVLTIRGQGYKLVTGAAE